MTEEKQNTSKNPRVLLVEDKSINRKMLIKILSNDYECLEAENGQEALDVLEKYFNNIDIVILDLQMPIMNGVEFLEIVKNDTRFNQIPIIIATTSDDLEVEHRALELGAIDYISKPYNPLIIKNRLRMICEVREKAILQFESERDQLTKIYNKQKFFQVVESKLSNGVNGNNFIITFDIENFKLFNELYGMQEGDDLLKYIAKVTDDNVNFISDVYCRLDRDNFAIYVEKSKDLLFPFIRKIENKIKQFNTNYNISLYFGIYEIIDAATTVNTMCDRANMAIEDVKGMYDKNIEFYLDEKRITLLKEQELLTDMMKAFDNDEYQCYIQPKVNMATGELVGGEALARWISDKRGLVTPNNFIPLAEKSGLISKIDFCIWEKVCQFLRKRLDEGKPIAPISVNISRVELYNKNLITELNNLVEKYQIDKKYLILEITETVYMENPEQMVQIARKLQEEGYLIHMDDFGSGYSSLNMLNELKFDVIKLDLRFMSNINADKKSENIVGFIMSLANWLNVEVIAEGVETAEQMEFLLSIGCIYGQGYFFGRPIPSQEFEKLLDSDIHIKDVINTEPTINIVKLNDLWDTKSSFSLLFQSFVGGICLIENNNDNFNLIRGNDKFYSIFGVTRDNLKYVKTQILSYIDGKDKHKINDVVVALSKNEESQPIELEIKLTNGERKFLHCNAKAIFKQKKYMYFLVSIEDLTELKMGQEKELLKEKQLRLELQTEKNAFERIYNAISCGILQFNIDESYTIINANQTCMNLLEVDEEEFSKVYKKASDIIPKSEYRNFIDSIKLLNEFESLEHNVTIKTRNNNELNVKCICKLLEEADGSKFLQTTLISLNDSVKKDKEIGLSLEQLKVASEEMNQIIFEYDYRTDKFSYISMTSSSFNLPILTNSLESVLYSWYIEENYKANVERIIEKYHDDDCNRWKEEIKIKSKSGEYLWAEFHFVKQFDKSGKPVKVTFIIRDIDEIKNKERSLLELSYYDSLTNLYNRKAFINCVAPYFDTEKLGEKLLAMGVLDIDNFKFINDSYGHEGGDTVLLNITKLLVKVVGDEGIIGRIGGDEFVVFLNKVKNIEDIAAIGREVCKKINELKIPTIDDDISCSIGFALLNKENDTFKKLYCKADKALYIAKNNGKNIWYIDEN